MEKTVLLILMLPFLWIQQIAASDNPGVNKQTFLYSEKNGEELWLDVYTDSEGSVEKPSVLFVFGGAFARGTRDREDYIPYFNYLVGEGYNVISIDYRLGLKGIGEVEGLSDEIAARMLINAVEMAVDDLLDATSFIIEHADRLGIDTNAVILNGSSAGAVTILQVLHELSNGKHAGRLPSGFAYAGGISFAGAILSLDGELSWGYRPAPLMIMHGDADRQVPYSELRYGDIALFGGKAISDRLVTERVPHYFYGFQDFGHEIASVPIREYWDEVHSFLIHFIGERAEPLIVIEHQVNLDKTEVENKDFTIADYLNGNFGL